MSCAILSVLFINAYSQDTICAYFEREEVYEFNFKTRSNIVANIQIANFYDIKVEYGDVLCLDLNDHKNRVRKVITTFFDGDIIEQFLDSKDDVYFSPRGTVKISVGKPSLYKI